MEKKYNKINNRIDFIQKVILWSFGVVCVTGMTLCIIAGIVNLF